MEYLEIHSYRQYRLLRNRAVGTEGRRKFEIILIFSKFFQIEKSFSKTTKVFALLTFGLSGCFIVLIVHLNINLTTMLCLHLSLDLLTVSEVFHFDRHFANAFFNKT